MPDYKKMYLELLGTMIDTEIELNSSIDYVLEEVLKDCPREELPDILAMLDRRRHHKAWRLD